MARRILTQQAMQAASRAVEFCYLCGGDLKHSRKGTVAAEHVYPRGACEAVRTANWWPVTLPVHRDCDSAIKEPHDDALIAITRAYCRPLSQLPPQNRAAVWKAITHVDHVLGHTAHSAIAARGVWEAIKQCIRGFHAVLYGEFLAADYRHRICGPTPGWNYMSEVPIGEQREHEQRLSQLILQSVTSGYLANEWDGISACGGALQYRCTWHRSPDTVQAAKCTWILDTPEAARWSLRTLGVAVPWRGIYEVSTVPDCATLSSPAADDAWIAEANRREAKRRQRGQSN